MEKIQKRVNALRNNQLEIDAAELKLSEEIIQLECKHAAIFDALYKKREGIVNGEREPNEDESKWDYENTAVTDKEATNGSDKKADKIDLSKPGIPDFWLKVLETARLTSGIIHEHDRPILKHLKNIKIKNNGEKPYGFTLEFHFEENEFFKNRVLTKSYEFGVEEDKRNPLLSTHNALHKSIGCEIQWNEGKSPVKEPEVGVEDDDDVGSFFDFFRTHTPDGVRPAFKEKPAAPGGSSSSKNGNGSAAQDDDDDELEHLFELDYEIGKFIKDMIIPKALMYYTGEIQENEDDEGEYGDALEDEFSDEDDDDNEDDDDESSEDEPESKPKKKKTKTK